MISSVFKLCALYGIYFFLLFYHVSDKLKSTKIVAFLAEFPLNGLSVLLQTDPSFLAPIFNLYSSSFMCDSYMHPFQWQILFEIGSRGKRKKKCGLLLNSQQYSV